MLVHLSLEAFDHGLAWLLLQLSDLRVLHDLVHLLQLLIQSRADQTHGVLSSDDVRYSYSEAMLNEPVVHDLLNL